MNPLYLGTSERRLFAIHEPPLAKVGRPRAAVLCNPWGSEHVYAHRSLRQLAGKLTATGHHTLRFDFFGTGDSGGDMPEADVAGWVADAATAVESIQDIAGTTRVTLIGLRLGGSIAAMVAARLPEQVEALVLWDPIVSGREYVSQLQAEARAFAVPYGGPRRELAPRDSDAVHVEGFELTAMMLGGLEAIDLRSAMAVAPSRSLMLVTQGPVPEPPTPTIEFMAAPCPWVESATISGALPISPIHRIVEWLG